MFVSVHVIALTVILSLVVVIVIVVVVVIVKVQVVRVIQILSLYSFCSAWRRGGVRGKIRRRIPHERFHSRDCRIEAFVGSLISFRLSCRPERIVGLTTRFTGGALVGEGVGIERVEGPSRNRVRNGPRAGRRVVEEIADPVDDVISSSNDGLLQPAKPALFSEGRCPGLLLLSPPLLLRVFLLFLHFPLLLFHPRPLLFHPPRLLLMAPHQLLLGLRHSLPPRFADLVRRAMVILLRHDGSFSNSYATIPTRGSF